MCQDTTVLSINHIVQTPSVVGGKPRIAGQRIPVHQIVDLYTRQDTNPTEIAEMFGLTLAQVHTALTYYYDHQVEINTLIEEERRYAEQHHSDTPRLVKTIDKNG